MKNVLIVGDEQSGKKTILSKILGQEIIDNNQIYYPIKITGERDFRCNFFVSNGKIKKLQNLIYWVMISDVIVLVNDLCQQQDEEQKSSILQLNKYSSIMKVIFEISYFLQLEKRIIVVQNKIDHPSIDFSEEVLKIKKLEIQKQMEKFLILNDQIPIINTSGLVNKNITSCDDEQTESFLLQEILKKFEQIENSPIDDSIPLRMVVISVHKILGQGIVCQGIILSGQLNVNDKIIIYPHKVNSTIKSIEVYSEQVKQGKKGEIVGVSLKDLSLNDIQKGYLITHKDTTQYEGNIQKAQLEVQLINSFNGIYQGFQLNLVGLFQLTPCFIEKIYNKNDFVKIENSENIADQGCICKMDVVFVKHFFKEKYDDFEKLGKFVIIESNVIIGFAKILKLF